MDALTQTLGRLADTLRSTIDELGESFPGFATELFSTEQAVERLSSILSTSIENISISDAVNLVRGSEPYGPAEYAACKSDKVTSFYLESVSAGLIESIQGIDQINETRAMQLW